MFFKARPRTMSEYIGPVTSPFPPGIGSPQDYDVHNGQVNTVLAYDPDLAASHGKWNEPDDEEPADGRSSSEQWADRLWRTDGGSTEPGGDGSGCMGWIDR